MELQAHFHTLKMLSMTYFLLGNHKNCKIIQLYEQEMIHNPHEELHYLQKTLHWVCKLSHTGPAAIGDVRCSGAAIL